MNTSECNMFVRTGASENDHDFPRNENIIKTIIVIYIIDIIYIYIYLINKKL